MKSQENRTLLVIFFTILMDLVGFGLIIPVSPFYAESLGASPAYITLLGAGYSLMQFLFAPFWGRLSDKWGRRPILLSSVAFATVGYVAFGFCETFLALFFARLLSGFGTADFGAAQAVVADVTPPERRARGMGILGVAFGLGFTLGPAAGGFLSQWGMRVPIFVAAAMSAVNFFLVFFLLKETRPASAAPSVPQRPFARLVEMARNGQIRPLLLIFLFYSAAFSMMEQVLGLFVERTWVGQGFSSPTESGGRASLLTAYALMVVGITSIIVQGGMIGRLVKKYGERKLLSVGLVLVAVSIAAIPWVGTTGSFSLFLADMVLLALGSGLSSPSLSSLLSRATQSTEQGHVMGVGQSLSALGRFAGPAFAGLLFEMGIGAPFWVSGAVILVCGFAMSRNSGAA